MRVKKGITFLSITHFFQHALICTQFFERFFSERPFYRRHFVVAPFFVISMDLFFSVLSKNVDCSFSKSLALFLAPAKNLIL